MEQIGGARDTIEQIRMVTRQEQISAMIDGELSDEGMAAVLTVLHQPGGLVSADVYYLIRHVLRTGESGSGNASFTADLTTALR
ncbi:MAG: RseA family anti-sigma factor, partial [Burkholderiaceae bacterium]|nr:RseA family anti-sigma factor [Burkholderiaceae bacterium]